MLVEEGFMTQTTARDLFKAAYENRYTWDANFPGYSADVQVNQGDEVYNGKIRINRDLSVDVDGIEDETVKESVYTQLRDIVTHRKRSQFEEAHGKNEFTLGAKDGSGATEILVKGDAMGSNYKIRGTEICQVSRVIGRMAFVIDTRQSLDTGDGYVSSRYDVVFRNPETNEVTRRMNFRDTFEPVGSYYIMTNQAIDINENGTRTVTGFSFSNVKLLEPATV